MTWTTRPGDAEIEAAIEKLSELLVNKGQDYASHQVEHAFQNFEAAAKFLKNGGDAQDAIAVRLAEKIERLKSLASNSAAGEYRLTEFEPIDDTLMDIAGYSILWYAYRRFTQE